MLIGDIECTDNETSASAPRYMGTAQPELEQEPTSSQCQFWAVYCVPLVANTAFGGYTVCQKEPDAAPVLNERLQGIHFVDVTAT